MGEAALTPTKLTAKVGLLFLVVVAFCVLFFRGGSFYGSLHSTRLSNSLFATAAMTKALLLQAL